jgi:hypothetical protein
VKKNNESYQVKMENQKSNDADKEFSYAGILTNTNFILHFDKHTKYYLALNKFLPFFILKKTKYYHST